MRDEDQRPETRLIHLRSGGRRTVNPPVERASTVLLPDVNDLYNQPRSPYGRMGLGVHRELETALSELEGGVGTRLTPNGLSACATAIAAMVKSGDHVLVTDSVYGPTRRFCTRHLARMGVEASFFDPRVGSSIADLVRDNTSLFVLESPGSLTMEIHDLPAIVRVAKARGIRTVLDNTWSAGVFHKPLSIGVDLSVQALTKYAVGHADAFGGAVIAGNETALIRLNDTVDDFGIALGPDEAYSALRGLRTLHTRLRQHEASAIWLAEALRSHPAVARVLHPALPSHPDHAIWMRDFTGSSGLFSLHLKPVEETHLNDALNTLALFGFGFSWGGYESLAIPCDPQLKRECSERAGPGPLVRIHVGLEDVQDLKTDLFSALDMLV